MKTIWKLAILKEEKMISQKKLNFVLELLQDYNINLKIEDYDPRWLKWLKLGRHLGPEAHINQEIILDVLTEKGAREVGF